tara:strand:- start:3239 stop:3490 length:252 start_codon:yes stop_codon:yes gene_type:complete
MNLQLLEELAGKGEQVIINSASGLVVEDFYKVFWVKGGTLTTITVDGQSGTAIDGTSMTRHAALFDVSSIQISAGIVIGYKKL